MQFFLRASQSRGGGNHGWLKTFHTFDVTNPYNNDKFPEFGALKVIAEDRVEPSTGFGLHPHREFEIFSYVVSGELEHHDSMGNVEILKRGDIQLTSAGTGIRHSEKAHGSKQVHFLQIWTAPSESRLKPQYFTRHFAESEKLDKWATVVAPFDTPGVELNREGKGPTPVHSPITLDATLLSPSRSLSHTTKDVKAFVHVVMTSGWNEGKPKGATVKVTSEGQTQVLVEGDGLFILGEAGKEIVVENVGDRVAEVLMFDIGE